MSELSVSLLRVRAQLALWLWVTAFISFFVTGHAWAAGPSFDCAKARSPAEKTICNSPKLSRLDRELGQIYRDAVKRAARQTFMGDNPSSTPSDWLKDDTRHEWRWREKQCRDDYACLIRWYQKRKAVLNWIAYSQDSFGDSGIEAVVQLKNGYTLIAYGMSTHIRNVIYDPREGSYKSLPDGEIKVQSQEPFVYFAIGQKGYFSRTGAFWFNSLRDSSDRILSIAPSDPARKLCFSKSEFVSRTHYSWEDLSLIMSDTICVSS